MVRFHIDSKLMRSAGIRSWYDLAEKSGLSLRTIYKLKKIQERQAGRFERLDSGTVDALCRALGHCQPGDFISYRKGA
jgi:DNA-binding Xre family transcriptional regulator